MFKVTRLVIELFVRTLLVVFAMFMFVKYTSFDFDSFDGWVIKISFMLWAVIFPTFDFFKEIGLWNKKSKR